MCRGICVAQSVWEMEDGADMVWFGLACLIGSAEVMAEPWRVRSKGTSLLLLCSTEQGRAQE